MFRIFDSLKQRYKSGFLKPLDKTGMVLVKQKSQALGSGDFSNIIVRCQGKSWRLHCVLQDVKLSPAGCEYYKYENGAEKVTGNFVISEKQQKQLLALVALHEKKLMEKYWSPENDVNGVESPFVTLSDGKTKTVAVKINSKTKGIPASASELEGKADAINELWDDQQSVNVECYISGYFYHKKSQTIRLCLSGVSVERVNKVQATKKKRKAAPSADIDSESQKTQKLE